MSYHFQPGRYGPLACGKQGHELYGTSDRWTEDFQEFLRNDPCRRCLEDRKSIHWELGSPGRYGYDDMRCCGSGTVKTRHAALAKARAQHHEHTSLPWYSEERRSLEIVSDLDRPGAFGTVPKPTAWEHLDLVSWDARDTDDMYKAAKDLRKKQREEQIARWVNDYEYFFRLGNPDGKGNIVWEEWVPLALALLPV